MRAEERRQAIQDILQHSPQPVSAGTLAARFSVSRGSGYLRHTPWLRYPEIPFRPDPAGSLPS